MPRGRDRVPRGDVSHCAGRAYTRVLRAAEWRGCGLLGLLPMRSMVDLQHGICSCLETLGLGSSVQVERGVPRQGRKQSALDWGRLAVLGDAVPSGNKKCAIYLHRILVH